MRTDQEALDHLCSKQTKVSSHFFINKFGKIYYLVDLRYRAWHAGKSFWKGEKDINSNSIGIEISNSGHHLDFEKYNNEQIFSLIRLLKYLRKIYKVQANSILAHSDIAPYRKIDPGEKFPWNALNYKKVVKLPRKINAKSSKEIDKHFNQKKIKSKKDRTLHMLKVIGYDISLGKKNRTFYQLLIKSYQMHYCRSLVSGKLNINTYKIIKDHYNQTLTI
tara:strand:- start:73 stop:732 length:660 start_codon:yes stop_codon:yes gene_type:complete